jgi:hypothetical protein
MTNDYWQLITQGRNPSLEEDVFVQALCQTLVEADGDVQDVIGAGLLFGKNVGLKMEMVVWGYNCA